MSQLALFDLGPGEPDGGGAADLSAVYAEARAIAVRLPLGLHFGTSSWSFPGWAGIVYSRDASQARLARDGLREYARHPLLTTVGIDRSYYAPIPREDLRRYAGQLPTGFRCCAKAPASVTSAVVPGSGRGTQPEPNADFLNPDRFIEEMLEPFAQDFAGHCGPFILECPAAPRDMARDPGFFAESLDHLLTRLPAEFQYAVELRDPALLTREYRSVLARHGAAHTYSYWSAMPMPAAQASVVPLDTAPFVVVRLLLRPGTRYEDRRTAFRPFNQLAAPDHAMREEVVRLVTSALTGGRAVFVLVNNKAEGSAPLTIRELARMVAALQSAEPG
jgi:uncharacterized protein YecE (DUF72 family)